MVRRIWDAWERRNTDALFALYDSAIIWENRHGPVELHTTYHGHEGVRQFWREWLEPFESFRAHADAFIDAGDNVVVRYRQYARGKRAGRWWSYLLGIPTQFEMGL